MTTPAQKRLGQKRLADIRLANTARFKWPKWTGFSGKTGWDWMQLLIIPVALAGLVFLFNLEQAQISDATSAKQHAFDQQAALDQQQEATLKSYLDDVSDLLLNHNLRNSKPGDEVREVARERTLTALRRLGADRNKIVLQFLHDANLIGGRDTVIDLSYAELSSDDLSGVNLIGVILRGARLNGANLRDANLSQAFLNYAFMVDANLSGAKLNGAILNSAVLKGAIVTREQLAQADELEGATMPDGTIHP